MHVFLLSEKKSRPKQALQLDPDITGFFKELVSYFGNFKIENLFVKFVGKFGREVFENETNE